MSSLSSETLLRELTLHAAAVTGFSEQAILQDAIRRAAELLLREMSPAELLYRAQQRDPAVVHALGQAVSVGETYFFRQPEHFRILGQLVPQLVARGARRLRAWSAGCATGEETYSMAACLLGSLPFGAATDVSVLGTDLLSRNVSAARTGIYGDWSQRPAGPMLYPLLQPLPLSATPNPLTGIAPRRVRVDDRVRRVTRFAEHNLLEPNLDGPYDVIFCRNVLVYFAREPARRAIGHLLDALVPGGVIVFGSMDAFELPPGVVAEGPAEQQVFRKQDDPKSAHAQARSPAPFASSLEKRGENSLETWTADSLWKRGVNSLEDTPSPVLTPMPALTPMPPPRAPVQAGQPGTEREGPVALHLRALVHVEQGDRAAAERAIAELLRLWPDYLPGLLERALLHGRAGERAQETALMREVLRRVSLLAPDATVAGPEPLPASFYRASAEAFLRAAQGPGGGK